MALQHLILIAFRPLQLHLQLLRIICQRSLMKAFRRMRIGVFMGQEGGMHCKENRATHSYNDWYLRLYRAGFCGGCHNTVSIWYHVHTFRLIGKRYWLNILRLTQNNQTIAQKSCESDNAKEYGNYCGYDPFEGHTLRIIFHGVVGIVIRMIRVFRGECIVVATAVANAYDTTVSSGAPRGFWPAAN